MNRERETLMAANNRTNKNKKAEKRMRKKRIFDSGRSSWFFTANPFRRFSASLIFFFLFLFFLSPPFFVFVLFHVLVSLFSSLWYCVLCNKLLSPLDPPTPPGPKTLSGTNIAFRMVDLPLAGSIKIEDSFIIRSQLHR